MKELRTADDFIRLADETFLAAFDGVQRDESTNEVSFTKVMSARRPGWANSTGQPWNPCYPRASSFWGLGHNSRAG